MHDLVLGPGVNIAPINVRYAQLGPSDWQGLAQRGIQHVRLCGWVAEPLMDWSTCPASTRHMPTDEDEAVRVIIAGGRDAPDANAPRAFSNLKQAARDALAAGLLVVLNPFHQRHLAEVSSESVRWIWAAVLREFPEHEFPTNRVAFEMVNEPANYGPRHVADSPPWPQIVAGWVAQVHSRQPHRHLILTGKQGKRSSDAPSVSSLDGLLADLRSGLVPPGCNHLCHVTFHYYEPRPFVLALAPGAGGAPPNWTNGEPGDLLRKRAIMFEAFERVANATSARVYLGEFGLDVGAVDSIQGALWLASVRMAAARLANALGFAVWTYFGTKNGLADGPSASHRLCIWDRSPLAAAALDVADEHRFRHVAEACNGLVWPTHPPSPLLPSIDAVSAPRPCPEDEEIRPTWADALLQPLASPSSPDVVYAGVDDLNASTVAAGILLALGGLVIAYAAVRCVAHASSQSTVQPSEELTRRSARDDYIDL